MSACRNKFFTPQELEVLEGIVSRFRSALNADAAELGKINDIETFERVIRTALMCTFDLTDCSVVIETEHDE